MKKIVGITLLVVMALLLLSGCGIPQEDYDAVVAEKDTAKAQVASLQGDLGKAQSDLGKVRSDLTAVQDEHESLQTDYDDLLVSQEKLTERLKATQSQITDLTQDLSALQQENESLQTDYDDLLASHETLTKGLEESTLRNPTWSELIQFIEEDSTDTLVYSAGTFDCEGFAITLRDRASRYGFRCAYVTIDSTDRQGHALNAFETTDKGVVYVDVTEHDTIAYVQVGQLYGRISLDVVKSDYIDCSGQPDEFWGALIWKSHSNPFDYSYFLSFSQRVDFLNQTVATYNRAVDEYNEGSTTWSSSQLSKWLENIEALEQDIGSILEPTGIVESIQVYWN